VVDDEAQLGEVVRLMLASRHDVVAETNPRAALARIVAGEDHDLILCDVMMPDMNGVDFYEALREARPRSAGRVVFMTGGVLSQRAQEFIDGAGVEVVQKPFTAQQLEALVAARVAAIRGPSPPGALG
jgi:CheY-like chemotaxis protein